MKPTVGIITNASPNSGVGSRAHEIAKRISQQDEFNVSLIALDSLKNLRPLPGLLASKSISWLRLARHIPKFDIYDLSNQTLSFITKKRHPSIVTVHDLIELTDPQDTRAFIMNRYLLSGIKYANKIVAVSEYTKHVVSEHLGIALSRITVIPNGVSETYTILNNFKTTIAYKQLLQDYKITRQNGGHMNNYPIIIHVGSEHPRKNLETVLRTIAILKKQYPDILLLKIGEPGIRAGRIKTLEYIDHFDLRNNVKLLGTIPAERINELYNIADALLFPSRFEGFGLPPIEAMAAGCPVVCSNATSLPEVVGDAASMHDPDNAEQFAASINHILTKPDFRNSLIERGIKRARFFSWDTAAHAMLDIYREFV